MFKKWTWPIIGAGALATILLCPAAAMAQRHDRDFHRHHGGRWSFSVGVGPGYGYYGPAYANGYYDAWGVWHPYGGPYIYGHYDRWGHWHRY